MDRINSQTRSGILLESLYYLDKYENERMSLYKSLVTANRIQIYFDFSTKLIYISAILPIDSVDLKKTITSPDRIVFPDWNEKVNAANASSYVFVPGYTESVDYEFDEEGRLAVITIVSVLDSFQPVGIGDLVYSSAATLQGLDSVLPEPRKNIQITLDEPNLKAIIEAILPFDTYLSASGEIVIIPLDN